MFIFIYLRVAEYIVVMRVADPSHANRGRCPSNMQIREPKQGW